MHSQLKSSEPILKILSRIPKLFLEIVEHHKIARFLQEIFEISSKQDSAYSFQTFENRIHVKMPVVKIKSLSSTIVLWMNCLSALVITIAWTEFVDSFPFIKSHIYKC